MDEHALRLGDLVDDYCPRCKLLLNHAIASMVDVQVVKVICKTCFTEHAFRHGEGGKKKPAPRTTLFDQVLAKTAPAPPAAPEPPEPSAPAKSGQEKGPGSARYITRHKNRLPRKSR